MTESHFNRSNLSEIMNWIEFQEINRVYIEYTERNYPNAPYITPVQHRLKAKSKTNMIQTSITRFIIWSGYFCERINTTGIQRHGKWTFSGSTVGSADLSAIIKGRTIKIEVKVGYDKQSEAQKVYENNVKQAGAEYWLVRSFTEFYNKYLKL